MDVASVGATLHIKLIQFSCQPPCFLCSAIIVMEGEGGLLRNNNKSVPLNTLDNSQSLAFKELQRDMGLECAEGSLFLIGLQHVLLKAKVMEKEVERERKHPCASQAH